MPYKLTTMDVALTVTFAALYVVFGFLKLSPIFGLPGQAITAAAIVAPLIGIILGPYVGTLCTVVGGIVGFSFGSLPLLSFFSGVTTALCSGLISGGRRVVAAVVYLALFLLLAFYPIIGPIWLFPVYVWFQVVGFAVLVSPLQAIATKCLSSNDNSRLLFAFFVTSFVSTLTGQIAGTLTFEIINVPNVDYFLGTWTTTAFLYPVERTIVALGAAFVGASLCKVLRSANLMPLLNRREKYS